MHMGQIVINAFALIHGSLEPIIINMRTKT